MLIKNLAPHVFRQRLLIEGFYQIPVTAKTIEDYFTKVTTELGLKMYGKPIIFSPGGQGKEENQGFDAFVPLIDSGISVYVWSSSKFFSSIIYTCKGFDSEVATTVTQEFFKLEPVESLCF